MKSINDLIWDPSEEATAAPLMNEFCNSPYDPIGGSYCGCGRRLIGHRDEHGNWSWNCPNPWCN